MATILLFTNLGNNVLLNQAGIDINTICSVSPKFLHLNYLCTLFRNDDKVKYTI